ncbi:hypothetical protein L195_g039179 [Trifolium pratense]|uniref:Uncharacterized protein n=2 Tax=Trifolium pratense TaxID=57577 RepID=A0A2K3LX76_TRIPR|nr:hypothetical protein L195_g039179 [Trifolium pratense]
MMMENRLCAGPCMGNPVNTLLSCNHESCFSCVDAFNQYLDPFPNHPMCPTCFEFHDFLVQSNKFLQVLHRVDQLLMLGCFKSSKIIVLHDDCHLIHHYLHSALNALNIHFFSYGEESNSNSVRTFIESDTRTILMPIGALTENDRFYFPPNSQLLLTFAVNTEKKNFILNRILTYGEDEDSLILNNFVVRNSVEEVIGNTNEDYTAEVLHEIITIASLLPAE